MKIYQYSSILVLLSELLTCHNIYHVKVAKQITVKQMFAQQRYF